MAQLGKKEAKKAKKKFDPIRSLKRDWQLWVMIMPALLYILIFCYGPMYGLQLAFRDYDFSKGITGGNWAGLKYFMQYFKSPMFWPDIRKHRTAGCSGDSQEHCGESRNSNSRNADPWDRP